MHTTEIGIFMKSLPGKQKMNLYQMFRKKKNHLYLKNLDFNKFFINYLLNYFLKFQSKKIKYKN